MTSKTDGADDDRGDDHAARAARTAAEAQDRLDRLRQEAGGALSGRDVARIAGSRRDKQPLVDEDAPPLDWRPTPRNIALQILAVALFLFVMWYLIDLFVSGVEAIFS